MADNIVDAERVRKQIIDAWRAAPSLKPRGMMVIDDLRTEMKAFHGLPESAGDHADALSHALKPTWIAHYPGPEPKEPAPSAEKGLVGADPSVMPEAFYVSTEVGCVAQYFVRTQLAIGLDAEIDPEDFGFAAIRPAASMEETFSARMDDFARQFVELGELIRRFRDEMNSLRARLERLETVRGPEPYRVPPMRPEEFAPPRIWTSPEQGDSGRIDFNAGSALIRFADDPGS